MARWTHSGNRFFAAAKPFTNSAFGIEQNVDGSTGEIIFKVEPKPNTVYTCERLVISFAADMQPVNNNRGMIGLSYDKLLNLDPLENGILFIRMSGGNPGFQITFKQLSDFSMVGARIETALHDGKNTFISFEFEPLPTGVNIESGYNDSVEMHIRDDLSSLLYLRSFFLGQEIFLEG